MIHVEKTRTVKVRDRETGEFVDAMRDARVSRFVTGTDGREYVATIAPEGVKIREKGRRTAYLYPWSLLHLQAGRMAADAIRGERAKRRRNPGRGFLRGR